MGRRFTGARALGPYERRRPGGASTWDAVLIGPDGSRRTLGFPTEREARDVIAEYESEIHHEALTVGQAVAAYLDAKEADGVKAGSRATTRHRLAAFFAGLDETPLDRLTRRDCERAYEDRVTDDAGDTQRNTLGEAKRFLRWCVETRRLRVSPAAHIKPRGKGRRARKPQLHADEARTFLAHAGRLADAGDEGALAALVALVLALRASEIVGLRVRDLDDDGRLLWVAEEDGKTAAARRVVRVPPVLAERLRTRAAGPDGKPRPGSESLWTERHTRNWPRQATQRLCRQLQIPVVTAHGLRGTLATIGLAGGAELVDIAAMLGHDHTAVTERHYAAPGSARDAARARGLDVLDGGGRRGKGRRIPFAKRSRPGVALRVV